MAGEIVNLFEINIDTEQATKDLADSQKAVEELKQEIKELKKAEGDNSQAIAEATAQLKAEQKELSTNTRLTQNAIKATNAQEGSIDQLRAQLAVTSIQWARLSKEERENTQEGKALSKQKLQLTEALKKEEKATGDTRRNVGNYNESITQSLGALSGFIPGLGAASTAMTGFGKATTVALGPIGIIITLIGGVVAAIKSFFTSSEEGQNTLRRLQAVFDVVFGNLSDILSNVGKALVEIFTNPKESILSFFKLLKENIINRFEGLLELLPKLGKAIGLLFEGEFTEAGKVAADAVAKVTLGVEDFTDKAVEGFNKATEATKGFIAEQEREIAIAQRLADQQAKLDKDIRRQLGNESEARLEIARLRAEAAKKEEVDAETRLKLLDEAQALERQITEENIRIAKAKADIKAAQNELSNSTKEDLDEEARLRADVLNLQTQSFNQLKRLESERQTALREIRTEEEAAELEELARSAEIAEEELRIEVEKAIRLGEIEQDRIDRLNEARAVDLENQAILEQQFLGTKLEAERQFLEQEYLQEIAFANRIGADTTLIEQKYSDARKAINEAETNAKLSLAADFAGNIAQIFGENTAVGKAAAIAQTTISTYQAATGAYASLAPIPFVGPALGVAAAGAAVAAGLANVKKIISTKSGLPGEDSGVGGGSISASTPSVTPPSSVRATVADDVNAGIVSRQTAGIQPGNDLNVQPTLVTDDVTISQSKQAANNQTSVV